MKRKSKVREKGKAAGRRGKAWSGRKGGTSGRPSGVGGWAGWAVVLNLCSASVV